MSKAALAGNAKEKVVEFGPASACRRRDLFRLRISRTSNAPAGLSRLQVLLPESEQLTDADEHWILVACGLHVIKRVRLAGPGQGGARYGRPFAIAADRPAYVRRTSRLIGPHDRLRHAAR